MTGKWTFQFLVLIPGIWIISMLVNPTAEAAVNVGNSSWVWQNPLPQGKTLNAISCPSTSDCFAVGDLGTILVTTNGGTLTPTFSGQPSPTTQTLRGISFPTTSTCVAVGDSGTVVTLFSSSWTLQQSTGIPEEVEGPFTRRSRTRPHRFACFHGDERSNGTTGASRSVSPGTAMSSRIVSTRISVFGNSGLTGSAASA